MSRRILLGSIFSMALLIWSCKPFEAPITDVEIDFTDSIFQKIYDLQDRQISDSLYAYFEHKDPVYRYVAGLAFGSIKNKKAVDTLQRLLKDDAEAVRAITAYSIGQIGDPAGEDLLIQSFDQYDTIGFHKKSNKAILEAVGKCASKDFLLALSTIRTYQVRDTALVEGQAWGIYRFALRGITTPEGTNRMVEIVTNPAFPVYSRFIAANYLFRAKEIDLSTFSNTLSQTFLTETDVRIRMALAVALGKTNGSNEALNALLQQFSTESDYRVKCNILRALTKFEYGLVQNLVRSALKDPNTHVANRAAQFFIDAGIPEDATVYWRLAKDTLPWQTRLALYTAVNKHLPVYQADYRGAVNAELRQKFRTSRNPYEKAMALKALAEYGWNLRFIFREGFASNNPVIRTASMEALSTISRHADFNRIFGAGSRRITRELSLFFKQAIETKDPAMISVAASALRNPDRDFKRYIDSLHFLEDALKVLKLPKQAGTYLSVQKTLAFFKGETEPNEPSPAFNHPIDWDLLESLDPLPEAIIKTSRGHIRIRLLPEVAPGSVANFVQLTKDGFYNGKTFHRVVPNFVIQTGCPRGDGYGGLDYTIRSELPPLHYDDEGYVGMASSGNHTEGTQFFITHSPTPHLDGNYTIFAKVTEGMGVVHQIQIGDLIEELIIL